MEKVLKIEGMMCNNCKMHVEKALNALAGVKAEVDLADKLARVSLDRDVADEILKEAVEEAGYEVVAVEKV